MARSRTLAALLGLVLAGVVTAPVSALAEPSRPDPGTGKPPPAVTDLSPGDECSLRPSADDTSGEFGSCLQVAASLSSPPAVGETAELRYEVLADVPARGAVVTVDLAPGIELVEVPAGGSLARTQAPHTRTTRQSVVLRWDLSADTPRSGSVRVKAVAAGPATLRVTADAQDRPGAPGLDEVHLTVAPSGRASVWGIPRPAVGAVVASLPAPAPRSPSGAPHVPVPHRSASGPVRPEGQACVRGSWQYVDHAGVVRRARNVNVEAWDADASGGNDLLTSMLSDGNGSYSLCFDNVDTDAGGTVDVYVRFVARNSRWFVRNLSLVDFSWATGTVNDIGTGVTHDFGVLQPGATADMPAMNIFDKTNDAWNWTPHGSAACWDQYDATCKAIDIRWSATSTDGSYFQPDTDSVHLRAESGSVASVIVHEIGHAVMDDVYDDNPVITGCPSPHQVFGASTANCAWSEGFAEWMPALVLGESRYYYTNTSFEDLEGNSWETAGWDDGDTVEGRVASAMIDISDGSNESPWDRWSEGTSPGNIWHTFTNVRTNNFREFWTARQGQGIDTASTGALASIYQSTIDYGLRDPLSPFVEATRPTPVPAHNYGFSTTTGYWSVVAVRPPSGADYELEVYDDAAQSTLLGTSTYSGDVVDFVGLNSNVRPIGDYYPRVRQYGGTGTYTAEWAAGANSLSSGTTQDIALSGADLALARDVHLTSGVPVTLRLRSTGTPVEAFLLPPQGVVGRSSAVATATTDGSGTTTLSYTPATTGYFGLVVTKKAAVPSTVRLAMGPFPLTVSKAGAGSGTVTSTPAGISCGSTCTASYGAGTVVTLNPSFATGSSFAGWSGACSGTGACSVTMDEARSVTATFTQDQRTLTVAKQGTGAGSVTSSPAGISCGTTCSASYAQGTAVTLTATPASGSTFTGWGVTDCPGTGTCTITLGSFNATVSPTFSAPGQSVTVTRGGTGSGTVTSSPSGISCGSTCSATFPAGSTVTLTAAAASGSAFGGWTGACTGTGTCTVTADSAKSVGATFTQLTDTLSLAKGGSGTGRITSSPSGIDCGTTCSAAFPSGSTVVLTATPDSGSALTGWSLPSCGTALTCSVVLDGGTTLFPVFDVVAVQQADLFLAGMSTAPTSVAPGGVFPMGAAVSNLGSAGTGSTGVSFWLSRDAVLQPTDLRLRGSAALEPLPGGATGFVNPLLTVPQGTPYTTYHVLACADGGGVVAESDETNNCRASSNRVLVRTATVR